MQSLMPEGGKCWVAGGGWKSLLGRRRGGMVLQGASLCAYTLRTLHVRTNGLSAFKMLTLAEDADDDARE